MVGRYGERYVASCRIGQARPCGAGYLYEGQVDRPVGCTSLRCCDLEDVGPDGARRVTDDLGLLRKEGAVRALHHARDIDGAPFPAAISIFGEFLSRDLLERVIDSEKETWL